MPPKEEYDEDTNQHEEREAALAVWLWKTSDFVVVIRLLGVVTSRPRQRPLEKGIIPSPITLVVAEVADPPPRNPQARRSNSKSLVSLARPPQFDREREEKSPKVQKKQETRRRVRGSKMTFFARYRVRPGKGT